MDGSTVPRAIEPLVAKGWIEISEGADRRRRYLSLSRTGRRKIDAAEKNWRAIQASVTSAYGSGQWRDMMAALKRLRDAAASA